MSSTVKTIKEEQAQRVGKLVSNRKGDAIGIVGGSVKHVTMLRYILRFRLPEHHHRLYLATFSDRDVFKEDDFVVQLVY